MATANRVLEGAGRIPSLTLPEKFAITFLTGSSLFLLVVLIGKIEMPKGVIAVDASVGGVSAAYLVYTRAIAPRFRKGQSSQPAAPAAASAARSPAPATLRATPSRQNPPSSITSTSSRYPSTPSSKGTPQPLSYTSHKDLGPPPAYTTVGNNTFPAYSSPAAVSPHYPRMDTSGAAALSPHYPRMETSGAPCYPVVYTPPPGSMPDSYHPSGPLSHIGSMNSMGSLGGFVDIDLVALGITSIGSAGSLPSYTHSAELSALFAQAHGKELVTLSGGRDSTVKTLLKWMNQSTEAHRLSLSFNGVQFAVWTKPGNDIFVHSPENPECNKLMMEWNERKDRAKQDATREGKDWRDLFCDPNYQIRSATGGR